MNKRSIKIISTISTVLILLLGYNHCVVQQNNGKNKSSSSESDSSTSTPTAAANDTLPETIEDQNVVGISLSFNGLKGELPESISKLKHLKTLNLFGCENLTSLPSSLASLKSLNFLILSCCKKLTTIPELPKKLEEIILFNCKSLRIDDDLMEKIGSRKYSADNHLLGKIKELEKVTKVDGGAAAPATSPKNPKSEVEKYSSTINTL